MKKHLHGAAALVLGFACSSAWAQQLDESLLEQSAKAAEAQEGQWMSNWMDGMDELGGWSVWLETDVSVVEEIQGQTTNNLREAAQLGQPSWNNTKLTNVLNRMNNGFDNVVDNWGRYVPNHIRIGASKTLQHNLSLGIQVGKAWSQAYVHCVDAEGNDVVASWNQVRHADLVDQFLFYDDLYNGNLWEFQNAGTFADGLETWRVELCASQELAYGLGWAASLGSSLGLNSEIARLASSFSGARAELSPEELGATLTPVSSAAASMVASLGATCRFGPVQAGLLWSSQSLTNGGQRNEWVAGGAEDIQAIRMMRLRLGMTF